MVHLGLGKHFWLELWLITLIVLSLGCPVLSWSKSTSEKVPEWSESFSSWRGWFGLYLCSSCSVSSFPILTTLFASFGQAGFHSVITLLYFHLTEKY